MSEVNVPKGTRLPDHLVTVGDGNRMPYDETPPATKMSDMQEDAHDKTSHPGRDAEDTVKALRKGLEAPRRRTLLSRIFTTKT